MGLKTWFLFFRPLASSLGDNTELQGCLEVGRTAMVKQIFSVFIVIANDLYFSLLL